MKDTVRTRSVDVKTAAVLFNRVIVVRLAKLNRDAVGAPRPDGDRSPCGRTQLTIIICLTVLNGGAINAVEQNAVAAVAALVRVAENVIGLAVGYVNITMRIAIPWRPGPHNVYPFIAAVVNFRIGDMQVSKSVAAAAYFYSRAPVPADVDVLNTYVFQIGAGCLALQTDAVGLIGQVAGTDKDQILYDKSFAVDCVEAVVRAGIDGRPAGPV